ncbi:protein transport protein SEC31 [Babesia caballi]|uniref:Protein transport protein SEC31 n=1 Tax=Babesia caballi TaxID=5871 RepID=A0AAV4LSW2_BABCB|nr:protein transport protein SEC31 [Babesia caballi]
MKGLGVFSPFAATSGCVLAAPCYDEFCGSGSPRLKADDRSLSLLGFQIREQAESGSNPFASQFEVNSGFSGFSNEHLFSGQNDSFGGYEGLRYGAGIGDFTTYHSTDLNFLEGNLTSLTWMGAGGDNGLVALGSTTGDVYIIDGTALVEGDGPKVVSQTKVCNTPLKQMSFNAKTNMLGVAGIDGQVSICDLTNPAEPKLIDASYGKWRVGLVTGMSWSPRLGHILATCGSAMGPSGASSPSDASGLVVWDLKARKPASSFRDPSGRAHPVCLEWHPEQTLQLIVGYGDDKSPALQLWDMRNITVPLKEIRGHTMGITSLAVCPHDPNLLLTSGRDDHTRLWSLDAQKGPFHPISSMQTGALSHHKRVQWHPHVPGLFIAQDTDDELSVHSAMCMNQTESYMPAWTRRSCGIISGFAGALTTWNAAGAIKQYTLGNQLDEETTKMLDESLEVFCALADDSKFYKICRSRVEAASDEFDRLTWSVMAALHKGRPEALVETLGFKMPNVPTYHERSHSDYSDDDTPPSYNDDMLAPFDDSALDDIDGEAFFSSLAHKERLDSVDILGRTPATETLDSDIQSGTAEEVLPTDDLGSDELGFGEGALCERMIVGDYETAAFMCLENDKPIEALFLAYAGGLTVWLKVAAQVTSKVDSPLLRTLLLVMRENVNGVVAQCPLDKWREALVYITTAMKDDNTKYKEMCRTLGCRLYASFQQGNKEHLLPASVLFMCSGDVSRVLDAWQLLETGKTNYHVLAKSVVRVAALSIPLKDQMSTDDLGRSATMLAEAFVDCGETAKAVKCLSLPKVVRSPQASIFLSRIQGVNRSGTAPEPVMPYSDSVMKSVMKQVSRSATAEFGTAPGAVANAMYPGMPVPWPLPTATQQKASNTRSTEDANRRIIATSAATQPQGERMKASELDYVTTVLGSLIAQGDTSRAAQDCRLRVAELLKSLGNGELSAEVNGLIFAMCRAIKAGDQANANIALSTISTKFWNTANKNWIMCLKRIVPKCRGRDQTRGLMRKSVGMGLITAVPASGLALSLPPDLVLPPVYLEDRVDHVVLAAEHRLGHVAPEKHRPSEAGRRLHDHLARGVERPIQRLDRVEPELLWSDGAFLRVSEIGVLHGVHVLVVGTVIAVEQHAPHRRLPGGQVRLFRLAARTVAALGEPARPSCLGSNQIVHGQLRHLEVVGRFGLGVGYQTEEVRKLLLGAEARLISVVDPVISHDLHAFALPHETAVTALQPVRFEFMAIRAVLARHVLVYGWSLQQLAPVSACCRLHFPSHCIIDSAVLRCPQVSGHLSISEFIDDTENLPLLTAN